MSDYNKNSIEASMTDKVFHFILHAATRDDLSALRQEMKSDIQRVDNSIEKLDKKMEASIEKLDAKIEKLDAKIDTSIEKLDAKIEKLDAKIDTSMEKLDAKIERLDSKIDKIIWGLVGITGAVITASAVQMITHFSH